jgi:hypothetical protein
MEILQAHLNSIQPQEQTQQPHKGQYHSKKRRPVIIDEETYQEEEENEEGSMYYDSEEETYVYVERGPQKKIQRCFQARRSLLLPFR